MMFAQNVHLMLAAVNSTSNCTVNGQPADCGKALQVAGAFVLPLAVLMLVLGVFWVISLMHLLKHDDVPNRTIWLVLHFIGLGLSAGIIYFFAVKRPYDKRAAAAQSAIPPVPSPFAASSPAAAPAPTVAPTPAAAPDPTLPPQPPVV